MKSLERGLNIELVGIEIKIPTIVLSYNSENNDAQPERSKRYKIMLRYIDDILFFRRDENKLWQNIGDFLIVYKEIGLMVHAEKAILFCQKVKLCG